MKLLFVGSVLPDAECVENAICNAAGNKFQKAFVAAVRAAMQTDMEIIAYEPARMFPRGRKVIYRRTKRVLEDGSQAEYAGFVNIPILKQLTQLFSIFTLIARWHRRNRDEQRVVILYNVFAPHALAVRLARRACGGRTIAFVADLPHGIYEFAGSWGLLERLDLTIQTGSIHRFDGLIAVTPMVGADFAPALPQIVLEGAVKNHGAAEATPSPSTTAAEAQHSTVLYAGTLDAVNGVGLMLDGFMRTTDPRYRLRVYGRGPLANLVTAAAERDPRIDYRGQRPNDEILADQREATVLLNARPSAHPITRYTFPSKLIEYMMSGRPVITTRLPGISPDYFPHLRILEEETPEALAALIDSVCGEPAAQLEELGRGAREFVLANKSWRVQGQRVADLIARVLDAHPH